MNREAFLLLRLAIDAHLTGDPVDPASVELDHSTGDLLVTRIYDGVERTHRITITEEPRDVPRETSKEP